MQLIQFGSTIIEVYPDSTRIIFPDGTIVAGAPQDTESYRATAEQHGYGADTLQLCKEHEVMHVALCHWLGIDSPTMRLLRYGDDARLHRLNGLEEAAVLAVQKFARAIGVDLIVWAEGTA